MASVKILEACQVPPSFDSPDSAKEFSLPLTFFDLFWLRFPPVERLYFYQLTNSTPDFFNSVILPKLKHSLSLTLLHFLPLAGRLTWPPNYPKPIILYTPIDGLPLTVAESDADFDRLSSNEMIDATESHPYVPELPISETISAIIALQITLFPKKGFTIGYCINHAVLDGKSITMFMKAWSYICKNGNPNLSPELAPIYDRSIIRDDPSELGTLFLTQWEILTESESAKNPRSLQVLPYVGVARNKVRSTFELTRENINKLKKTVSSSSYSFSTFVITCAYISVCMVKARGELEDKNRRVWFAFSVDCRSRLEPPVPANYFGNCIAPRDFITKAEDFTAENGVCEIAERVSGMIKGLENGVLDGMDETLMTMKSVEAVQMISVAGSTTFQVYGCDFGWGKPKKVDITSIDRTGAVAINESRDGNGGVEIGLALPINEMEAFSLLFVDGLKHL
ncbi:phenolic glucoside malonyltransferase 1-like [Mercurialis annua]|uniref:phenolic glucoside malonyltransferase 1-like n=1 Tax=Mercurialis annua TaxID=3986 RepID=UPI00215EB263|nr:phenolic glucoside malonyltransferase 1-like [Mercurialis annua]